MDINPCIQDVKETGCNAERSCFIGPPLSRENSWVDAMYNYSDDLKQTFLTLERFPTWTWPLLHPFLFKFLRINERRKMIEAKLRPIVAQQNPRHDVEGDQGQKTNSTEVGYQGPDHQKTLFNWVRERLGRQKEDDIKLLARIQLRAALAGMDTVSHALTNVIYDLAAYPEYVEPLREEIVSAIGTAKVWSKPAMEKLDKMDSFIKESMRVNPMYLLTMSRAVTSPLSLDENTTLQKGTLIAFSQQAAHFSSGKQHCGDLTKFDGFRYSRLRAEPANVDQKLNLERYNFHKDIGNFCQESAKMLDWIYADPRLAGEVVWPIPVGGYSTPEDTLSLVELLPNTARVTVQ
ncbi:cytochrome P450 [Hyaloscypha finlandica]|nr:cytochrome P450 [Hyaloscypha finlandica]